MRFTAIAAIAVSASSAAGDNAKSAKSTSGASAGISQTSVGILPQLEGSYLGNFSYQWFNATTNALEPRQESNNRPIKVYRNPNYDAFVAYEYDDNGIANLGGITCLLPNKCAAFLKGGLQTPTFEDWIIEDEGKIIQSVFINQNDVLGPVTWIGTFTKVEDA